MSISWCWSYGICLSKGPHNKLKGSHELQANVAVPELDGTLNDYHVSPSMTILQVVQNQSVTLFQKLPQIGMTDFWCQNVSLLTDFDFFLQFYLYKRYTILVGIGIQIQNGFHLIVETDIAALSTCLLAWSMPATFLNALHFSSSQHLWKKVSDFFSHKDFFWSSVHL